MPQPQAYERQTDFTERDGDDTDHAALNQELDAAALSIEGIRDNLALIQKDDGALKNGIVTPDSLAPETFIALQGDVADAVAEAEAAALSALTSATTANNAAGQAATSATAAQTSQTAAALNATGAAASAVTAAGAQAAVAASAAAALVSEDNAADSEAAALVSANGAAASAAAALADKNAAAASAAAALVSANNADASEAAALVSQNAAATSETNAGNSETAAAASEVAAAASAASTGLPGSLVGKLLNFLRVKADESGYEHRTAVQARGDMGAAAAVDSAIQLNTANGYGGGGSPTIRRLTNIAKQRGSYLADYTVVMNATVGTTITINTSDFYTFSYSESVSAAQYFGLSINSSQLTSQFLNINRADRLCGGVCDNTAGGGHCGGRFYIPAGSVIRPHTNAIGGGTADYCQIDIERG